MIEFRLPSLGSDMDEGKLLEWHVKPGDQVKRGDVVAVVNTAKAAIDVESWSEGVVHELVIEPQTVIPVGTVMAILREPGETAEQAAGAWAAAQQRSTVETVRASMALSAQGAVPLPATRRRISPAARKHAVDLGVDLDKVTGTGPDGAVTVSDVERAAQGGAPAAVDRALQMRQAIAAAMSRSKREIPHYYLSETIALDKAVAWLQAENAQRPVTERVLMAGLFVKAVALACKRYPDMNGFYRDGAFEPVHAVHAGVAIALRQGGLIAPALQDAETKPLAQLMRELGDLVQRARSGSLRSSELSDPTIPLPISASRAWRACLE
jgi:pyruvate dehydrogenase E2 component (dihydrolipoamide acetyltransferase)